MLVSKSNGLVEVPPFSCNWKGNGGKGMGGLNCLGRSYPLVFFCGPSLATLISLRINEVPTCIQIN